MNMAWANHVKLKWVYGFNRVDEIELLTLGN